MSDSQFNDTSDAATSYARTMRLHTLHQLTHVSPSPSASPEQVHPSSSAAALDAAGYPSMKRRHSSAQGPHVHSASEKSSPTPTGS